MAYIQPANTAVDFVLDAGPYHQPPSTAVDFDLAEFGGAAPSYQTPPGLIVDVGTPWRPRPEAKEHLSLAAFQAAVQRDIRRTLQADTASTLTDDSKALAHGNADHRNNQAAAAWGDAEPYERDTAAPHSNATPIDIEDHRSPWSKPGTETTLATDVPFLVMTPWKDRNATNRFYSSAIHAPLWRREENLPAAWQGVLTQGRADFSLGPYKPAHTRPGHFEIGGNFENNPIQPKDPLMAAPFKNAPGRDSAPALPWGPAGSRDTTLRFEYPDYTGPISPWPGTGPIPAIEQEAYNIVNTVNVTRGDGTPLDIQNITIGLDVDSWAWTFTGEVFGKSSLAMVQPDAQGMTEIEVELNGHTWVFMIESYSGNRAFANERYQIHGVSRTQLLAAPYAPLRSYAWTTGLQAQQIIDDQLLNTGFAINWQATPSWFVEADAFSVQDLSPIAIAKRVAEAAGAILVPATDADELTLQPRLRISPWSLTAEPLTSLDAQIPAAMITAIGLEYQPAELYDSVYISGETIGESALVTRAGHGGTAPAPAIFDALATDTDLITERARQVIGASGNRGLYQLTLPIPEFAQAPGLVIPGMVIEVIEGAITWRGYVLGTAITAPRTGAEKLEQQLSIARFYDHE